MIASRCNGCGYCEQRCPVKGESAIVVVPDGEIRLAAGSYIREAKKLQLEFKPDPGDNKYLLEESGLEVEQGSKEEESIPADRHVLRKPKGFFYKSAAAEFRHTPFLAVPPSGNQSATEKTNSNPA